MEGMLIERTAVAVESAYDDKTVVAYSVEALMLLSQDLRLFL